MTPDTLTPQKTATPEKLWTAPFAAVNAIMFLAFCNMAVFFRFYAYLEELPIDKGFFGIIIGLFALVALIVRPIISPLLGVSNSRRWIAISCVAVVGSLLLYNLALSAWSMVVVRLVHGGAYVVMATASVAQLVNSIPPSRSGQAFGIMAVITLLPYAVVPPLVDGLMDLLGGYLQVLNLTAALMLLILPLCLLLKGLSVGEAGSEERLSRSDMAKNLRDPRLLLLLGLALLVFTAFTPVFYFVERYATTLNIADAGWFFTISTCTEIAVRLFMGSWFDRGNKLVFLAVSLVMLIASYVALAVVQGEVLFFALAVGLGLGWGVAMPMINSLLFDISRPRFRAMNANLGLEMFQGGFLLGPLVGGWLLQDMGYSVLFMGCAGLCLAALLMTPWLGRAKEPTS